MTTQIGDSLRFQGEQWAILATRGNALFEPRSHGMNPVVQSTACYRGFWCEFECDGNSISLRNLAISLTPVHSKKAVIPPEFAGVKPRKRDEVGKPIFAEYLYENLRFGLNADVRILIATDFIRSLEMGYGGTGFPWQFRKLMDLTIMKGTVTVTEDLSLKTMELRKRVIGGTGARREKHRATRELCHAFDAEFPFWAAQPAERAT